MPRRKKTVSGEPFTAPGELPDDSGLAWAHPLVKEWFIDKFGSPTEPQLRGWPHIIDGRSVLISAPTGSGKTLAAFLACIDTLVRKALDGSLTNKVEVLYISPLKALSNDVNKNLEKPLAEILELAQSKGIEMADIRTAVRTGDTLASERRAMLLRPPHILVTTPESFYILLTAEKSRAILGQVSTVIVDEIHALADDKRGSHLSLSLERLEALCHSSPVRIGLSATQKPIEDIARFLVGTYRLLPEIIQVSSKRKLDLAVEVPGGPVGGVASNDMWGELYDRIAALVDEHRSTLIFVNTRRLAERVAHNLACRVGEEFVGTHHGSLSRRLRLAAEEKLKSGEYKVLVATASLELGIDIGNIDLVCQMGSPRSIAVALQRIGRAGHWRGAIPKGRLFATTRDELIECAAVVRAIREGELDRIIIPECPRDVLMQQIVAACATNDWSEESLFSLLKSSYPYRNLNEETYQSILELLTEGLAGRKVRYGRYLHRDTINKQLRARRGSRMLAITNGGAIPDNSLFIVMAEPEQVVVGTVDEDFAVESNSGDIFLLGNTSWMVRRVLGTAGIMFVQDAHGAPPNVPFWRGEAPARTPELSKCVSDIRERLEADIIARSPEEAIAFLMTECGLDKAGAEQVVEYIAYGRRILGAVPSQKTIVAERFFDESGGMQLIIHAPFGGRINKAWGLALRKRFCKSFNLELQASATDDGINISLTEQHSFPLADVFHYIHANSVTAVLEQTALQSPLFTTRWRWDANRALALLRFSGGKKVPPTIQRMRAEDLLAAVFPQAAACQDNMAGPIEIPKHPLVDEVMDDVLHEALDLDGLIGVLRDIDEGRINCVAIDTPQPSVFAHEILNANPYAYLDDAPLEERRARAVEMRRILPDKVQGEFGRLDPAAIERVCLEAQPDIRDEEELQDLLKTVVFLPAAQTWANGATTTDLWNGYFDKLVAAGRAFQVEVKQKIGWVAVECTTLFERVYNNDASDCGRTKEDIIEQVIAGWLMHSGPTTASTLVESTGLVGDDVQQALLAIEGRGSILRGNFTNTEASETEWCDRGLLARIHRLTIGAIRKLIEPVSAAQYMTWLFSWQHVAPSTQLVSEHGTLEIIKQLQGFEVAASGWESQVLSRRIKNYRDSHLDNLCLTGQIGWARLSPHPALVASSGGTDGGTQGDGRARRVIPTSASPIAFYVREDCEWMKSGELKIDPSALTSQARKVLEHLSDRGASFFVDIVRVTRLLKSEVEMALWELVTAGLVTADGFDNLRALTDQKRRSGQGLSGRPSRSRHSQGRWSRIHTEDPADIDSYLEAVCWMLLRRYGVVFRELLTRETNMPRWRDVLIMLRRLEAKGTIRGGRFVNGFLGEQFAISVAVESLRLSKNTSREDQVVKVAACDPLNLVGIIVPGDRVAANSSSVIVYRGGVFESVEDLSRSEAPLLKIAHV